VVFCLKKAKGLGQWFSLSSGLNEELGKFERGEKVQNNWAKNNLRFSAASNQSTEKTRASTSMLSFPFEHPLALSPPSVSQLVLVVE
jgi:hypothetical protein